MRNIWVTMMVLQGFYHVMQQHYIVLMGFSQQKCGFMRITCGIIGVSRRILYTQHNQGQLKKDKWQPERWTIAILASLSTNFLLLYLGCWEQPCLSWAIFSTTYSSWENVILLSKRNVIFGSRRPSVSHRWRTFTFDLGFECLAKNQESRGIHQAGNIFSFLDVFPTLPK